VTPHPQHQKALVRAGALIFLSFTRCFSPTA
jgi:hypothetical protein